MDVELTFRSERVRVTGGVVMMKNKNVSSSSDTQLHGLVIDYPTSPQGLRYRSLC